MMSALCEPRPCSNTATAFDPPHSVGDLTRCSSICWTIGVLSLSAAMRSGATRGQHTVSTIACCPGVGKQSLDRRDDPPHGNTVEFHGDNEAYPAVTTIF